MRSNNPSHDKIWEKCIFSFLMDEINLLNPKVLVFQGNDPYDTVIEKFKNIEPINIEEYFRNTDFPKFGKIKINSRDMYYLKIYHTGRQTRGSRKKTISTYNNLIKNEILPIL